MQNGRASKSRDDLNRYTLADVIGQAGTWLYEPGDRKKKLTKSDVASWRPRGCRMERPLNPALT